MNSEATVQPGKLAVEIEWDAEERVWIAQVPVLNNLSTYGDTYQDAADKCREAILGYFEASGKESLPLPLSPGESEILLASLVTKPS